MPSGRTGSTNRRGNSNSPASSGSGSATRAAPRVNYQASRKMLNRHIKNLEHMQKMQAALTLFHMHKNKKR
jgi:hypothetical protein